MSINTTKKYTDFGIPNPFEQAEIAKYSDSERWQYEESKKVFWDNYSVMKTAVDKALKQGHEEGHAKGLAEGIEKGIEKDIEKGIEKGIKKGAQQEKLDTIHRLQSLGLSVEQIALGAGMSVDEVKKLLK